MVLWASYVLTSKAFGCRRKLSESIWLSELSCWNVEATLDCLWVKLTLDYLHAKVKSTAGAIVMPHITSLWNKQNWIEVWKKTIFPSFLGTMNVGPPKWIVTCWVRFSSIFHKKWCSPNIRLLGHNVLDRKAAKFYNLAVLPGLEKYQSPARNDLCWNGVIEWSASMNLNKVQ